MNKKKILLTIVTCCLMAGMAQAQSTTNGDKLRLSLEEAQQYAVEHNYTLQNSALDIQKSEASKWQTLASMLPQVKAGFDYQNMCGYEMNLGGRGGGMVVATGTPEQVVKKGKGYTAKFLKEELKA